MAIAAKRESTIMALRMSDRFFFMVLSPFGVIVVNVAASPYGSKTLTAQWNQPPWYWSVLRSISFRLGTGNGFTIDLKVKLVTVVLCWVYVIIQRKNMSSIFCPKQAVFSY